MSLQGCLFAVMLKRQGTFQDTVPWWEEPEKRKPRAERPSLEIMTPALDAFPIGNTGQDGAHAAEPSALILSGF